MVAFLFGPVDGGGPVNGVLSSGTITEGDLINDFAGDFAGFVTALMIASQPGHTDRDTRVEVEAL